MLLELTNIFFSPFWFWRLFMLPMWRLPTWRLPSWRFRCPFMLSGSVTPSSILAYPSWGQFHQHSSSSFCMCRSQKHKKDSQLDCLFCAFGICAREICSYEEHWWNWHLGWISPTFYTQLLSAQIPKTQKIQSSCQSFCAFGTCTRKSCL